MSGWKKLAAAPAADGGGLDVTDVFGMSIYMGNNGYKQVDPRLVPDASEGTHNTTDQKYYFWSATFSPEGDKCFIGGRSGNSEVHEYTLPRPFDIGTGYKTATFDFSAQTSAIECVKFSTDGTVMFIGGYANDRIYQYTLSTGFDISTASYANKSLDLSSYESSTQVRTFDFKADGTKLYVFEFSEKYVRGLNLSTSWDISTASSSGTGTISEGASGGVISPDGTKFFVSGNSRVYEYTMSTAFNETTVSSSPTSSNMMYHVPLAADSHAWLSNVQGLTQVGNLLFLTVVNNIRDKVCPIYLTDENDLSTMCNYFQSSDADMSEDGGLAWFKQLNSGNSHGLYDTERGITKELRTDTEGAEGTENNAVKAFARSGFAIGSHALVGTNGKFKAWQFRKTPNFFDIVTYTGTGSPMTISHNLGTTVGSFIIKCRDTASTGWPIYHRGMGANKFMYLNSANSAYTNTGIWQNTTPTSTHFYVGSGDAISGLGKEYVAYLFAHNDGDGIFGPDGDQDIIKMGSYTGNGSDDLPTIDLGFEPEFLMVKNTTTGNEWTLADQKHGWMSYYQLWSVTPRDSQYYVSTTSPLIKLKPDGFTISDGGGNLNTDQNLYIYWAIRKGPLRQPLHGMEVYAPQWEGSDYRWGYAPWKGDLFLYSYRTTNSNQGSLRSKLLKSRLITNNTSGENVDGGLGWLDFEDGYGDASVAENLSYMFRQAPGFMDEVLYKGDGASTQAIDHNLGSVPKMIWVKQKASTTEWQVYVSERGSTSMSLQLDSQSGESSTSSFPSNPTDTQFTVGNSTSVNSSGNEYYAVLWGEVDGVTKFGSYTGTGSTGTTHTITGLNSPARWVMIKEVDGSGGWWVFDSVLGLDGTGSARAWRLDNTAGYSTASSITDAVTATSNGFTVSGTSYDELNESGKKYFYWAIT